jgi:hypothetical protein
MAKAKTGTNTREKASGKSGEKSSVRRAPSFFKVYATNVITTATREDFRVEIFNERFKAGEGWVYWSEGSLILTRGAAKKLSVELAKKVEEYETEHGEIKAADELGKMDYSG